MQDQVEFDRIGAEIFRVILSSSNCQVMLSDLAGKVGEFFQADICAIISYGTNSADNQDLGLWHNQYLVLEQKKQILQQLSRWRIEQEAIARAEAAEQAKSSFFEPVKSLFQEIFPTKTLLGTVTKSQGQVNGAILLLKTQSYQWTNSEQKLLKKISASMAIAISQVQLQQQTKTKTRYQTLLNHLSREISASSDPDLLFDNCLAEIGKALQIDQGMILMLKYQDPLKTQRNRQQIIKGTAKIASRWLANAEILDSKRNSSFKLQDSSLCQQALQLAPQFLAISELKNSVSDLPARQLRDYFQSDSSALLMMPLMGKKTSESQSALVLGFLVLQHNSPRLWIQDELDLIDWISVQLSTAIIHHQTLNQVQSIVEERTAQLKWSLDVQAKLSEKMRQQIDQLQKLNQLKDDFMNSMSHELKTPLTSMKMAIEMLRQAQLPPAMREKYLNILEQEWNREYNLIKDLLTLQQVESGEFTFSPQELNLKLTIHNLAKSFNQKWQADKGLILETEVSESALNLYTDSESLEHILNELLLNAGKYSNADTTIKLSVSSQIAPKNQEKQIAISVSNYGSGITPEEISHVFKKFHRGKGVTDRAVPGTGLGLTLVKYLVDHLNGTIEVKSEPVDDSSVYITTFTVKLPQFPPS